MLESGYRFPLATMHISQTIERLGHRCATRRNSQQAEDTLTSTIVTAVAASQSPSAVTIRWAPLASAAMLGKLPSETAQKYLTFCVHRVEDAPHGKLAVRKVARNVSSSEVCNRMPCSQNAASRMFICLRDPLNGTLV